MNNVISCTNAGKREYGDDHWFWAVWINVAEPPSEPGMAFRRLGSWNKTEPTECGFRSSKREAKRASWAAIKRHVPLKAQRRAYLLGWARQYLWSQWENDDRPEFSRCKICKDKWLWVVFRRGGWYEEEEPLARGVAKSPEAACEAAVEAVGPVRQEGNWLANAVREKEAAIKRSQRTTEKDDAAVLEFVYECHRYCSEYHFKEYDSINKHRIVKKTKKRIYVDREPWRETVTRSGNWRDFQQRTFILDRQEFEDSGKAKRSGCWYGTYYADPGIYHAERKATAFRSEHLVILDLPADAPVEAIHKAYRRFALQTHPDKGGNAEEFKRVTEAYEAALAAASCA